MASEVARFMGLVDALCRLQAKDMRLVNMRNDDWIDRNEQPRNDVRAALLAEVERLVARHERITREIVHLWASADIGEDGVLAMVDAVNLCALMEASEPLRAMRAPTPATDRAGGTPCAAAE